MTDLSKVQIDTARRQRASQTPAGRRKQLQADWEQRLGHIHPREKVQATFLSSGFIADSTVAIECIDLETEPGIWVPMTLMIPNHNKNNPARIVVAVSQSGRKKFLYDRSQEIAELLDHGVVVCLPDVREAGTSRGSRGAGSNDTMSHYALFFETPMLGYRLRDLRAVLKYLRTHRDLKNSHFALWGDSFTPPNAVDTDFQVPKRVHERPMFSEPLGGLLAMLGALYEDDVKGVYIHGGLNGYRDVLASPYVYIPHDVVVPGVLPCGDLADLAAALAPCPLRLDGLVDGLNRTMRLDAVRSTYEPAIEAYHASDNKSLSITNDQSHVASWLIQALSGKR